MMLVNLLNPLLNALFNHPSPSSKIKDIVHTISTSTGYTILVPQTDKLEWCVDKDTSLPFRDLCLNEDFIASHIIQVPVSSRNHQRARYLHTLNGRTVVIKDNEIFTHKGFKSYAKAKIVSEYLFNPGLKGSVPSDGQFVVYEIDTSLVGSPMLSKEVSPTISSRYQLLPTINEKSKPKKTRGVKIRDDDGSAKHNFETLLAKYPVLGRQLFGPLSLLIDNFDTTQCNSEEELLNALDNAVEVSIQIFQSGDTNVINSMVSENDLSGEDITDLLHVYVESYVCRKLWDRLVAIRKDKDEEIFKAASKIKNVDIAQIGLPPFARAELLRLDKAVAGAVREINKLPSCFGTDAKIDVLLSALNVLSGNSSGHSSSSATRHKDDLLADERLKVNGRENMNGSGEEDNSKISVNADILVSLMVLVLARSSLENLDSELFYIKNFTYRETGSGTLGYALLTLEGVLYHITHETDKLVELSSANEALWDAIKDKRDFSAHMETVKSAVHDWQSVFQSRTSSGESALMLAVQSQNLLAVQGLLALPDVMTTEYILSDKTDDQTTLLLAAVQSGNKEIINMLLERLDELPDEQQREYFAYEDQWKRSLGHYLFHAPWIIKRVGSYVDWNKKDINGQTPLFALCRCYDHPQYHELLDLGFQAWSENSGKLDVLEHIDNRGNTLLHIMKDRQALEKVMRYKVDVNWPNDRGLTPLMIYSKYSRMSAILLLRQNPQLDIERTDNRGLTALEIAKDPQTLSLLDELYLFEKQPIGNRSTAISRTMFIENELYFIIKSGLPPSSSSVTTVKRTFADFIFLQKWLAYENPYSWIPSLKAPRNPFTVSLKLSRQIIHEVQARLNAFLRVLLTHPTYSDHELLWEFILIQDFSKSQSVERCRKKLENKKEANYEDSIVYHRGDLELIEVFFRHACDETERLNNALCRLSQCVVNLQNKYNDLSEANCILGEKLYEVEFLANEYADKISLETDYKLTYRNEDKAMQDFGYNMSALANTAGSVITALHQPMGMVSQLENVNSQLYKNQLALERLNNKNAWPLGIFEDKRDRDIRETEDRIYLNQSEIRRLSSDIKSSHITSASELGGFYNVQEAEIRRSIEEHTHGIIRSEREKLSRLKRLSEKAHC